MDKLFRWLVILVLSLLTAYVVIAEYIEVPELQTPVEVIVIKKEVKEVVVEKPVVKKQNVVKKTESTITKNNTQSWQTEADAQPDFSTYEVQELIRKYAWIYGVDVGLALRIAGCESGYRWKAKNKISSAWWVFQFLSSTFNSSSKKYWRWWESRFNADANIDVAIQKLKNEWWSARLASKSCRWK